MANMSYCRFRNTAGDLGDCLDDMDADLSADEHNARVKLIRYMINALENIGCNVDFSDVDVELLTRVKK
jgi:hypothetical protein